MRFNEFFVTKLTLATYRVPFSIQETSLLLLIGNSVIMVHNRKHSQPEEKMLGNFKIFNTPVSNYPKPHNREHGKGS